MIRDLDGKAPVAGIKRRPLGDGPRLAAHGVEGQRRALPIQRGNAEGPHPTNEAYEGPLSYCRAGGGAPNVRPGEARDRRRADDAAKLLQRSLHRPRPDGNRIPLVAHSRFDCFGGNGRSANSSLFPSLDVTRHLALRQPLAAT
jgi:hypothetical protein